MLYCLKRVIRNFGLQIPSSFNLYFNIICKGDKHHVFFSFFPQQVKETACLFELTLYLRDYLVVCVKLMHVLCMKYCSM